MSTRRPYSAVALEEGTPPAGEVPAEERLRVFAAAYRRWANTEPRRYRLLFAAPLPGYDPQSRRLVTASREAMQVLLDVLEPLTPDDTSNKIAKPLGKQLDQWTRSRELGGISATLALRSVTPWSMHGFCSLEIEGNFASMGLDADLVFNTEVNALLTAPPRSN